MSMKLSLATIPMRRAWQPAPPPRGSLPDEVRGLVFDACDVLYDATVWRRWLLKVLGQLGLHTSYRSFYHIWDRDFLADVCRGRREFWEAFRSFLLSAGLARGQIEEVQVAARTQRSEWLATMRPFPSVRSTLGRLRECGVPLAAICDSECPRETIHQQLRQMGLDELLRVVICSRDLGHAKPEAACYLAAVDALGLVPRHVAFVGHDNDELAAAAQLGMPTIAFNQDLRAQADVYLARFDELAELVFSKWPLAAAG